MLSTEIIDRPQALFELEREWRELLGRSSQDHLYLTHEYLSTWWKHLSGSASLCIILIREAGELLAIAPLMLTRGTLLKCPVRRVEFAGSGWGYGGFILYRKKRECLGKIFETLEEMDTWDVMFLGQMLGDPDIASHELAGLVSPTHSVHDSVRVGIPYIPLQMTGEQYLADRSASFRRNLRNRDRKLNTFGKVDFRRITRLEGADVSLTEIMGWIRAVAEHSWKAKAGTAISSDPHVFAFFAELAGRLNEMGSLDLSILFVNQRPVAYIFGARYKDDYFELDIAFDSEFSVASPGTLVRNCLLRELFQKQSGRYDFVAYFDYKKELTSYVQDAYAHVIYRRRPYPLVLRWLGDKVRGKMGWILADHPEPSWGVKQHVTRGV